MSKSDLLSFTASLWCLDEAGLVQMAQRPALERPQASAHEGQNEKDRWFWHVA